ncbi:MAG TPA: MGMT family protein [bacterium]|nr:MGMT family protein [bacterium]
MRPEFFDSLFLGVFKTNKGWCAAAWTLKGLSALVLPQSSKEKTLQKLSSHLPPLPKDFWDKRFHPVPAAIRSETRKALAGKNFKSVPVDLFFLTEFQKKILSATSQIPWGQTRTYGWVAAKAGSPKGFRAAGQALNRNPVSLLVPCHRVIAGGSKLGGYGGGLDWKIKLLKMEKLKLQPSSDGSYKVG